MKRPHAASSTLDAAAWLWFQARDDNRFMSFVFDQARTDAEIKAIFDHIEKIKQERERRGHRL